MEEIHAKFLKAIDLVPDCNVRKLVEYSNANPQSDDALIAKYGYDALFTYFEIADEPFSIVSVSASDTNKRDKFDKLVELELARSGRNIAAHDLAMSLKLKDLNEIVKDITPKPFTRKNLAYEFLIQQDDALDRISKVISLRGIYQILPPTSTSPAEDFEEIVKSWTYDKELSRSIWSFAARGDIFYKKSENPYVGV